MKRILNTIFFTTAILIFIFSSQSCSKEEDVRTPDNILGVWSPEPDRYIEFSQDYRGHDLRVEYRDGESIGIWDEIAYLYEPGYELVVYLTGIKADVYKIVSFSENGFTWCPVKEITVDDVEGMDDLGKIMGDVIKEAQAGFHLNPELYVRFTKVPENKFLEILDSLDVFYPW